MGYNTLLPCVAFLVFATPVSSQVVRVADTDAANDWVVVDVARAPSGLLAAAWTLPILRTLHVATSNDGGLSWTERTSPDSADRVSISAQDPGVIDLVYELQFSNYHVRSTDGGLSWSTRRVLPSALLFRDRSFASTTGGRLAILYASRDQEVRSVFSQNAGATWQDTLIALTPNTTPYGHHVWLSATDYLACWQHERGGGSVLDCSFSTDGGITFALPVEAFRAAPGEWIVPRLARGPAGEALLAVASRLSLQAVRSLDFGRTWGVPQPVAARGGSLELWTPSITANDMGEAWIAISERTQFGTPVNARLFHTSDRVAWAEASTPPDLPSCALVADTARVLAGSVGELYYRGGPGTGPAAAVMLNTIGWRTLDAAATWDPPRSVAPLGEPTHGVRVQRLASGRLVSLWLTSTSAPIRLLASYSDDRGATWSTPVAVADGDISLGVGLEKRLTDATLPGFPRFDATATADGGLVVAWVVRAANSCGAIRVSRSLDGSSFAPSDAVGDELDQFPLSIAEDGSSVLVASWSNAGSVRSARSLDGGRNWSPAIVVTASTGLPLLATEVVTIADGSLGIGVIRDAHHSGPSSVEYFASRDGGSSWTGVPVTIMTTAPGSPTLVDANLRAVLAVTSCPASVCVTTSLQSYDFGASWLPFSSTIRPSPHVVGHSDGSVRWVDNPSTLYENAVAGPPRQLVEVLPPSSESVPRSLVFDGSGWGMLFADWEHRGPAGIFYARLPCTAPVLTASPPPTLTACVGSPLNLSVAVTAEPGLAYQWYWNSAAIMGATLPDLSTIVPGSGGTYHCMVTNSCWSTTSASTLVTAVSPPGFYDQPRPTSVCAGSSASFAVRTANATGFQWERNGVPLPGATLETLTLPVVTPADEGDYVCVATGSCGSIPSRAARLDVPEAPSVTGAPLDQLVCEGRSLTLTVRADDATGYQWNRNGVPIAGATAANYDLASTVASDAGGYVVDLTGPCGATSAPSAEVTITQPLGPLPTVLFVVRRANDAVFTWTDVVSAASYQVANDLAPDGSFNGSLGGAVSGSPGLTVPYPTVSPRFYRLVGINACGRGTP